MAASRPDVEPALRLDRVAVAFGIAGLLVVYALRGGTYDVVVRGEAGIALWWALGLGLIAGVVPRRRPDRLGWAILAALGLLLLWTALGFAWTESDERTSVELARIVQYIGLAAVVLAVLRRRTVPSAIAGATVAAAIVCGLAVASRLVPDAFPLDSVKANFGGRRLSYPLNYWNGVGAWGAMASAMCLTWSAHARTAIARGVALAGVPLCVTAVYLTYSRAGAAGVALGTLVVLAASRTRLLVALHAVVAAVAALAAIEAIRHAPQIAQAAGTDGAGSVIGALLAGMVGCAAVAIAGQRLEAERRLAVPQRAGVVIVGAIAVAAIVVGVAVLPPVVDRALDEFQGTTVVAQNAADPAARLLTLSGNRNNVWGSAEDAFGAASLHGTGPGTFEFWWNRDAVNAEHVRDAHSIYLEALAETGWPGFLILLALCGALLTAVVAARRKAVSRRDAGAATAALAVVVLWLFHAGVDWIWEEAAVTGLALVVAAAAAATHGRDATTTLKLPIRAAAAAVCVVAILLQLPPVLGTSRIRDSQRAVVAGDLARAAQIADDAAAAWPWATSTKVQRALVREAAGQIGPAIDAARVAAAREPTNWRHPLLLARLLAEAGRPDEAVREYRRAQKLRPFAAPFR